MQIVVTYLTVAAECTEPKSHDDGMHSHACLKDIGFDLSGGGREEEEEEEREGGRGSGNK